MIEIQCDIDNVYPDGIENEFLENHSSESEEEDEDEETNISSTGSTIKKIRNLNKKIKKSEVITKKLKNCCNILDLEFKKPIIDCKTRWNSTYNMLKVASNLKDALIMLCETNFNLKQYTITVNEWARIELIVEYLGNFEIVYKHISGENRVTLPDAVRKFNVLLDYIEKTSFSLNDKEERDEEDEKVIVSLQAGKSKLLLHYNKFNWIYSISLVLDPRIKSIGLDQAPWGREMKEETVKKLTEVYIRYNKKFGDTIVKEPCLKKRKTRNETLNFDVLFETSSVSYNQTEEIDQYLNATRPNPDMDVLDWWKNHQTEYPVLALVARDILSIQATSVPVERLFSRASLIVNNKRSLLKDESIRELLCINRWMKSSLKSEICKVVL
ncbi:hypothetical protein TKK_0000886 [Trichogramma kaykai]